jgi:VIT1/CCC1 family predicted Fe2+/Mn2+ transporter
MSEQSVKSSKRVLEPYERISEVLFGLIMVLTFTGSLSVAQSGEGEIHTMLIGALGCNIAWGVIDGVLYLMGSLAEKGKGILAVWALRRATDTTEAHGIIADALPSMIAGVLAPVEFESIRQRLLQLPEPPKKAGLDKSDWMGAFGVFLLVFLSTLPVVFPFVIMKNAGLALRSSNVIAIVMLFGCGFIFGRITGRRPWLIGLSMVILGLMLVGMTMALGG